MSFHAQAAAGHRGQSMCSATPSSDVVSVGGAAKCGRSPTKLTPEGVRGANMLHDLGLAPDFRGQRPSPSCGEDFTALGAGLGVGEGLRRGARLNGVGSIRDDLNPSFAGSLWVA